jgi:hypothetical protein
MKTTQYWADRWAIEKQENDRLKKRIKELERRCNASPDVILQRFMAEELRRKELEAKHTALVDGLQKCDRHSFFGVGEVCDPDPDKPQWLHESDVLALLGDEG